MASSIAGSIAGGLASTAASKLLGGGGSSSGGGAIAQPYFKNLGGYRGKINDHGRVILVPLEARTNLLNSLTSSYKNTASDIRGYIPRFDSVFDSRVADINNLLAKVQPGFGALTQARVDSIQGQRQKTISDTSSDFARRGILGSSLASGALSSIDSEFSRQEADAKATSFLEELDVTTKLLEERFTTDVGKLQTSFDNILLAAQYDRAGDQVQLDELNNQVEIGMKMLGTASSAMQAASTIEADLAAQAAAGAGKFAGLFGNQVSSAVTDNWDSISSFFTGLVN